MYVADSSQSGEDGAAAAGVALDGALGAAFAALADVDAGIGSTRGSALGLRSQPTRVDKMRVVPMNSRRMRQHSTRMQWRIEAAEHQIRNMVNRTRLHGHAPEGIDFASTQI